MSNSIIIPSGIAATLHQHFFQNEVEQGAFLFAEARRDGSAYPFMRICPTKQGNGVHRSERPTINVGNCRAV